MGNESSDPGAKTSASTFDATAITGPIPALHTYYLVISLLSLIFFPVVYIPSLLRYMTLRYRFDDTGVAMSWGFLFHKEIYLTFRRLQDIHVTRNVVERWLGLAKVAVQTASGSGGATMKIEGVRDPEALRDYLYERMRGAREGEHDEVDDANDEVTRLLTEIRDAVRQRSGQEGGGE